MPHENVSLSPSPDGIVTQSREPLRNQYAPDGVRLPGEDQYGQAMRLIESAMQDILNNVDDSIHGLGRRMNRGRAIRQAESYLAAHPDLSP